jgi:pyruvate dehydrogenase E2 component (dihydrolipoamide acetyltransferase)
LEKLRKKYSTGEHKVTVTSFIIKVAAAALKHFPQFNASLDTTTDELIYKKYYHIGVAVDTPHGLLVPVILDVDKKSIIEISKELADLAEKARNRQLGLDAMSGGTFTITNLGGIGGTAFTPIVNYPQAAILGVARSRLEPCYQEGQKICAPTLMLPLCLSYDHRIVDGADGARFIRWIADAIENPLMLEMEG